MELASQTLNLIYAGPPVVVAAVLDQDVSDENAALFPFLYGAEGPMRTRLNTRVMLAWLASALAEAAIIYYLLYAIAPYSSTAAATPFVFELGTWATTAVILAVSVRLAMSVRRHDVLFMAVLTASVLLWVAATWIFDAANADDMRGGMRRVWSSSAFWLFLLLAVALTQLPVAAFLAARRQNAPVYRTLVQEYQLLVRPRGEASARAATAGAAGGAQGDGGAPTSGGGGGLGDGAATPRYSWYQRVCTCGMRVARRSRLPSAEQLLDELLGRRPLDPEHPVRTSARLTPDDARAVMAALPDAPLDGGSSNGDAIHRALAPTPTAGVRRRRSPAGRATQAQVAALVSTRTPRWSLAHRSNWRTLPLASDVRAELVEWPYEQRIRSALRAMAGGGAPPEEVLARRDALVKARLSAAVERGQLLPPAEAEGEAELVTGRGAAGVAAPPPHEAVVVGRGGATTVVEPAVAPEGATDVHVRMPVAAPGAPLPAVQPALFRAGSVEVPPTPAHRLAARRRPAMAATGVVPVPEPVHPLPPAAGTTLQPPTRPPLRRTGSDMSMDASSTDAFSALQSSFGLQQRRTAGGQGGPQAEMRRTDWLGLGPPVPGRWRGRTGSPGALAARVASDPATAAPAAQETAAQERARLDEGEE